MDTTLNGLTSHEAQKRLIQNGKNTIPHKKPIRDGILILNQLKSPLIYILIFAAIVSLLLQDVKDTLVIIMAVLINTILGFYQERKAQKALYALKLLLTPTVQVIRDAKLQTINSENLVTDDIVLLSSGDHIPADCLIIEAINLHINEAALTGESVPVIKEPPKKSEERRKNNYLYMGTTVISGRVKAVVVKTGLQTEFGKIAKELSLTHEEETPLQIRIGKFATFLALVTFFLSLIILIVGVLSGKTFVEMFTTSVALAVAVIPEGLTVSLTTILALGMQRILKRKALVRRLVATEALGSVTVIATDKTGTLTEGIMAVVKTEFTQVQEAIKTCVLANNREDPLEIALWEYAQKNNIDPEKMVEQQRRIGEIPFESDHKFMAIAYEGKGENIVYLKGAPEILLDMSDIGDTHKNKWLRIIDDWANQGLRIIGLGYKKTALNFTLKKGVKMDNVVWLGLVGIADPVRETVKETIQKIQSAGIKLKVVTGDYALTSLAILKKLNIDINGEEILEGDEIEKMSDEDLGKRVERIKLFARVTPTQKLRIVNCLQKNNEVVALVGDGINDAPAIKAANIGIVVSSATDVARQTADIVLLDSNFNTIAAAIEEGRGIYENIKKVILYLLSDAFAEVVLVFGSIIAGLPLPLTASQILWINIITDGLPNLALTVEPRSRNLLEHYKPINPKSALLDTSMRTLIMIISVITGIYSFILFFILLNITGNINYTRTILFATLGFNTLIYVFSVRTLRQSLLKSNLFFNPWLVIAVILGLVLQIIPVYSPFFQSFLGTVPLILTDWLIVLIGPIIVIILIELFKTLLMFSNKKASF